jgi:hypothetical protein
MVTDPDPAWMLSINTTPVEFVTVRIPVLKVQVPPAAPCTQPELSIMGLPGEPLSSKVNILPFTVTLKVPADKPPEGFTVAIVLPVAEEGPVSKMLLANAAMGKARAKSANSITRLIFAP